MNWKKSAAAVLLISALLSGAIAEEPSVPEIPEATAEAAVAIQGEYDENGVYHLPDGRTSLYVVKEGEENPFLSEGMMSVSADRYQDENMCITISSDRYTTFTTVKKKEMRSSAVYCVADIYIRDLSSMQRVYASGKFGNTSDKVATMATKNNAILAVNGDYASEISQGVVIANGVVKRKTRNQKRDMGVIWTDGSFSVIPYGTKDDYAAMLKNGILGEDNVWQLFLFGPSLLDEEGNALPFEVIDKKTSVGVANPRTIFGYYEPGHYCIVVCEGRTNSSLGWRLEAAAIFMSELGCKGAYNLDGGQSSQLWFNGAMVNNPYKNGRKVNDILIFTAPTVNEE